jgi:hypothetical protein
MTTCVSRRCVELVTAEVRRHIQHVRDLVAEGPAQELQA